MDSSLLGRLGPWPIRTTWILLPLLIGPVLGDALADTGRPTQIVASVGLWGGWFGVLLAALVPVVMTLTVVRLAAPVPVVAALLAVAVDGGGTTGWQVLGLAWAVAVAVAAFLPTTGASFVNGSSYGDEVRLPLRVPGPLLLGPVQLTWAAVAVAVAAGPLLLAAGLWVPGAAASALGVPVVWWGVRVLHTLARRWTVLVPGGLVLHDPLALADPTLFRRASIRSLGPAPAGTDALDLTRDALGLAVEARFERPVSLVLARNRRQDVAETVEADAVLFTPTRPGVFLGAARQRSLVHS